MSTYYLLFGTCEYLNTYDHQLLSQVHPAFLAALCFLELAPTSRAGQKGRNRSLSRLKSFARRMIGRKAAILLTRCCPSHVQPPYPGETKLVCCSGPPHCTPAPFGHAMPPPPLRVALACLSVSSLDISGLGTDSRLVLFCLLSLPLFRVLAVEGVRDRGGHGRGQTGRELLLGDGERGARDRSGLPRGRDSHATVC